MPNLKIPFKKLTDKFSLQDFKDDLNSLNDSIEQVNSQMAQNTNLLEEKLDKTKQYKVTRTTKKTFDDAVVLNVNNTGKAAEICGFRNDSDVATYADRDNAIIYIDNVAPKCVILQVVGFTATSVTVTGDTTNIEPGMIIDCMNQSELLPFNQATKFSGFVTSVEGQKINVSGWYQLGNTATGQIPDKDTVIVNPVTKIWGINGNIFLNQDSFGWGGVIAEFGMFNRKSAIDSNCVLNGIDVIAFDGRCDFGYKARKAGTTSSLKNGFISDSAIINFESKNGTNGYKSTGASENFLANGNKGFVAENTVIAFQTRNDNFRVDGDGNIKNLSVKQKVYSASGDIAPRDAMFHILSGAGTYNLPDPAGYALCWIKIFPLLDVTVNGKMFTNTGSVTTKSAPARRQLELFSDGQYWHIIF